MPPLVLANSRFTNSQFANLRLSTSGYDTIYLLPKQGAVFNYYRRELEAIGVTTSAQFSRALTNRAKRLSRAKSLAAHEMANS